MYDGVGARRARDASVALDTRRRAVDARARDRSDASRARQKRRLARAVDLETVEARRIERYNDGC